MASSRSDILPPPSRLDATALALEKRGDLRNLIRFVERWHEFGDPSAVARMAQARAFVQLRLMDKATIRLERLVDVNGFEREALVLLGQCYTLRGWKRKARAVLHKALVRAPDDKGILSMLDGLDQQSLELDDDVDETEIEAEVEVVDPDQLVVAAEQQIASGAFLKAQALIERARRIRPNNPHAADLLWGMAGDYHTDESMTDLVAKWGPEVHYEDLPEDPDYTEHTESFNVSDGANDLLDPTPEAKSFPSLFKDLDPVTETYTGDDIDLSTDPGAEEKTQTASLASLGDLSAFPDANPDAPTTVQDSEDTQIAMVIRPEGHGPELTEAGALDFSPAVSPDPSSLVGPTSDFDPGLEEEDDDLIILTGKERTTGEPAPRRTPAFPLEPDPTTSDVSGRVQEILEQVQRDRAAGKLGLAEAPAGGSPPLDAKGTPVRAEKRRKKRRPPAPFSATWWLFAIGAVLCLVAMLIFALAGLQLLLG